MPYRPRTCTDRCVYGTRMMSRALARRPSASRRETTKSRGRGARVCACGGDYGCGGERKVQKRRARRRSFVADGCATSVGGGQTVRRVPSVDFGDRPSPPLKGVARCYWLCTLAADRTRRLSVIVAPPSDDPELFARRSTTEGAARRPNSLVHRWRAAPSRGGRPSTDVDTGIIIIYAFDIFFRSASIVLKQSVTFINVCRAWHVYICYGGFANFLATKKTIKTITVLPNTLA